MVKHQHHKPFSFFHVNILLKYFLVCDKCCIKDNFIVLVNAMVYNTVSWNGVI
jgi:hypothetical protein